MNGLNALLDQLPRTRFGRATREVPAFRTCGIAGFYVAVVVALGGSVLAGLSPLVMAVVALACALSFFVYVYVRRWITGRETLELIDQVWFAELCAAGTLWLLGAPVLLYLDVMAVALCPFLAAGRIGCTLVGCCHGRPSSLGITYGEEHARDGFPAHLVGIRLFPVPALEALGLLLIGAAGLLALPFASPGRVLAWFLIAYGVLRFGLEGLRGDRRPHWLGLSKPRWMALVEFGVGVSIIEGSATGVTTRSAILAGLLLASLVGALVIQRAHELRPRLLSAGHVRELRDVISSLASESGQYLHDVPLRTTALGVSVGVSAAAAALEPALHLSLALPDGRRDLPLLCDLAARASPDVWSRSARMSPTGVLHLHLPADRTGFPRVDPERLGGELFATVSRQLQAAEVEWSADPSPLSSDTRHEYFGGVLPDGVAFRSRGAGMTTTVPGLQNAQHCGPGAAAGDAAMRMTPMI